MAATVRGGTVTGVVFHTDQGSEGGINRSSQHLDSEELRWDVGRGPLVWATSSAAVLFGDSKTQSSRAAISRVPQARRAAAPSPDDHVRADWSQR